MSTTIDDSGANTYFGVANHIKSGIWTEISQGIRTAALAQAKRMISRQLGAEITDETVDVDRQYYPDRATYEQAIFLIENSDTVASGNKATPKHIGVKNDGTAKPPAQMSIGPEAKRWMGWGTGHTVSFARA